MEVSNKMMSYTKIHHLNTSQHHARSIRDDVFAFSCGRAKTIRIRFVWMGFQKHPDTCGRGLSQLVSRNLTNW